MSTLTRWQVFDQLDALGIASAWMGFYGGGDEGDVQDVAYRDGDGHVLEVEIDERSELFEALCQPIYDRFGGFDGDPEIDADLIWTVATRSLAFKGSTRRWTPFEEAV